jgi:hypothetical protein
MKNILLLLITLITSFNLQAQEVTLNDLRNLKADFEKKYSITLFIEQTPFSISKFESKVITKEFYKDLYEYMIMLDEEMSKYPLKFLWKTRLRAIALVRSLIYNYQLRGAIPDYGREILFFDILNGSDFEIYQRHVIHHEFYHMIEQELNGSAYWKDPIWSDFNHSNFNYGNGGVTMQENANASVFSHPQVGFLNLYSQSGHEEDKAEIFASLFVKQEYTKLKQWSQKDKVLKNKMDYMMKFLIDNNKNFNPFFWDKLHSKTKQSQ